MAPRDQRDAVAEEHRDHADDELVDRSRVEKRGDEIAAPHQPDVLAGPLAQASEERRDAAADELHAGRDPRRDGTAGEHVGRVLRVEPRSEAQAHLVGDPAEQLRVDRLLEGVHAVEALRRRAGRKPLEIALEAGDVSVGARGDVHDDSSSLRGRRRASRLAHFSAASEKQRM